MVPESAVVCRGSKSHLTFGKSTGVLAETVVDVLLS